MMMKSHKTLSLAIGLAFAFTFTFTLWASDARASATDKTSAKTGDAGGGAAAKGRAKGEEVTLKGDLGCGKCSFKTTKACQNVLKVTEGGKDVMYYLAANAVSEQNHEAVCSGVKPATVKGTVSEEGKGAKKKKVLVASEIKID
jgi:hypothetical protein